MPGMDGFETAARIKRRARTKDVPIIFLTAVDKDPNSSYRGLRRRRRRLPLRSRSTRGSSGPRSRCSSTSGLRDGTRPHRVGHGHRADGDDVAAMRKRFVALEEAVRALASDLSWDDASSRAAVERVERHLDSFRAALAGLGSGAEVTRPGG